MARYRMKFDSIEDAQAWVQNSVMIEGEPYEVHILFEHEDLERVRSRKEAGGKRKPRAGRTVLISNKGTDENPVADVEVVP